MKIKISSNDHQLIFGYAVKISKAFFLIFLWILMFFSIVSDKIEAYDNVYSHRDINRSSVSEFARDVSFDVFGKKYKKFKRYDFQINTYKTKGYEIKESGTYKVEEHLYEMEGYEIKESGIFKVEEHLKAFNYQKWIETGGYTADEPELYSSLRHFYDPKKLQNDKTTGEKVSYLTDHASNLIDLVNNHSKKSIYSWLSSKDSDPVITDPRMDAREWALTGPARRGYKENRYSLRKGIDYMKRAWAEKNIKIKDMYFAAAWRACGETMHLLSDMTVPAHVRNDAHPAGVIFSGLRYDPYEYFVTKNHHKIESWSKRELDSGIEEKIKGIKDVSSLFHQVALLTNENFFSSDTITGRNENGVKVRSANGMIDYPRPSLDTSTLDVLEGFYLDRRTKIPVAHKSWADNTWWNVRNYLKQTFFKPDQSFEELVIEQAKLLIPLAVKANIKLLEMFIPELTVTLTNWDKERMSLSGKITHLSSGVYADSVLNPIQRPLMFNSAGGRGKSWSSLTINKALYNEVMGDYELTIIDNRINISIGKKIKLNHNGENTANLNLFFGGFWVRSNDIRFTMKDSIKPPVSPTYTKVDTGKKSGYWSLYKTIPIDGCSFFKHQCYNVKCSSGIGSWQVAVSGSTCSKNGPRGTSGSGSYTVPPSKLIPGNTIRLKTSVSGVGGFHTSINVSFYRTSKGLQFDSRGNGSLSPDWSRSIAWSYNSRQGSVPEGDFKIPEDSNKSGVLLIYCGGGGGTFETSMIYFFLYKWKE